MASYNLDQDRRRSGEQLIAALQSAGIELDAAFWTRPAEIGEWRFILVTKQVETKGPKQLARQVYLALQKMEVDQVLTYYDVDFYSPNSPLISIVAKNIGDGMTDSDFGSANLGGYILEGFMVYFIRPERIIPANGAGPDPLVGIADGRR